MRSQSFNTKNNKENNTEIKRMSQLQANFREVPYHHLNPEVISSICLLRHLH